LFAEKTEGGKSSGNVASRALLLHLFLYRVMICALYYVAKFQAKLAQFFY
jgi:hypothetical protein